VAIVTVTVLLVDDDPDLVEMIQKVLEEDGRFEVRTANNGFDAGMMVKEYRPDLIILDVMLPDINGKEVCQRVRSDDSLDDVRIICISGMVEQDKVQELRDAGANDFLIKPVDRADLVLRVRNSVRMKHLYDGVASQYAQLRELEASRDALVHMIIHDLRSPMAGLSAYLQLLRDEPLTDDGTGYVRESLAIVGRLHRMTGAALEVSRFEAGKMPLAPEDVDLTDVIKEALELAGPEALPPRVIVTPPPTPVRVTCDRAVIGRVFVNLIDHAIRVSPRARSVRIGYHAVSDRVRVEVSDEGPEIPEAVRLSIFEDFVQAGAVARSRHTAGLGLAFCRLAVEAHGGEIGVTSAPDSGTTFWFHLPV